MIAMGSDVLLVVWEALVIAESSENAADASEQKMRAISV